MTVNNGRRGVDRIITTIVVAVLVAGILGIGANGLAMWRQNGVFEEKLDTLTLAVADLKSEVRDLRQAVYQRLAERR